MRVKIVLAAVAIAAALFSIANAAPPPGQPDPIGQNLFPPDLVIAHADAIGLTESQRNAIESAMVAAQTQSMKIQFRIQESVGAIASLLSQPRVDESKVMAKLDQELDLERQMKHAQLGLMISVKNALTGDQQAKLQRFKGPPGQ